MEKITMITGATSGIGEACADKYATNGYDLIITGRRTERLAAKAAALRKKHGIQVLPLAFDIQDRAATQMALDEIPAAWRNIAILVNNAGLAAGRDSFESASMVDWETMLNTNVHGLLYVSQPVANWMIAQKKGHIVNLGSIAGKQVYEKGNVYCASKFAVDAITQAMRIDLLPHGIRVTGIHPGAVETEFALVRFKGDKAKAAATYTGITPLTATDIADTIYYCTSLPAHVCINDLVIMCTQQASAHYFHKTQ